jgi:hypothetical protein
MTTGESVCKSERSGAADRAQKGNVAGVLIVADRGDSRSRRVGLQTPKSRSRMAK